MQKSRTSRFQLDRLLDILVPFIAVAGALAVGAIILWLQDVNPLTAYEAMITGAFTNKNGLADTLVKAIPLLLVALGVAMIVSIDLASQSASRAFRLSTGAVTGNATHRIVGGPAGIEEEIYRRLRVETGFSPAAPVIEGYVLAQELGARYVLLDDELARRKADLIGLPVAGTLAVLLMAKEAGLIPAVGSVLAELTQIDFRVSERVYTAVLAKAGELGDWS